MDLPTIPFLKTQADKILLLALIVVLMGFWMHMQHHEPASAGIPWLEKSIDTLTGSLLTLITGQLFRQPPAEK